MDSYLGLHPVARRALELLKREARRRRIPVVVTSTVRSTSQQRALYDRWRAGKQLYPVARPGTSTHEYGLAFDLIAPGRQADLVALARALGLTWAGPRDEVHFQVIPQATWSRLLRSAGL